MKLWMEVPRVIPLFSGEEQFLHSLRIELSCYAPALDRFAFSYRMFCHRVAFFLPFLVGLEKIPWECPISQSQFQFPFSSFPFFSLFPASE